MRFSRLTIFLVASNCLLLGCASRPQSARQAPTTPNETRGLVENAKTCYGMGYMESAKRALDCVLDQDPGNAEAQYYLRLVVEAQAMQTVKGPRIIYPTIPPQIISQ